MFLFSRLVAAFAVALTLSYRVNAIGKITRTGRYLYSADGTRFYIKAVAYQEQGTTIVDPNSPFSEPATFIDPLANGAACQRDLPYLQQLGVNSVRVYSVNASLNHDTCMQAFSSANIYVILDLTLPVNGSINRNSPSWTTNLLDSYIRTINAFSKYDNILAYNIGNEIITSANQTAALPFIKAAARDTKAFLASKGSSALVGYAGIDMDASLIVPLANYLSCDPSNSGSSSTSIDLFGLNNYELCGDSTFAASYAAKTTAFASYNVVAYFSEYGCNNPYPRPWADVAALFSSDASAVWSGGVAFSYFPAQSDAGQFGMVTISTDGSTVTPSTDFTNLKAAYGAVQFVNTPTQSNAPAASYPACPAQNTVILGSSTLPPTPVDSACQCVEAHLSCQFNPQTSNTTVIVGALIDTACGLLGSCPAISGFGTNGTYGLVSGCDPATQLSFVMSQYYEANNRNAQACSFAGNGTVNKASTSSASAVASSCLASATGVSTPTTPSTNNPGSGSSSGSGSKSTKGAATSVLVSDSRALLGVFLMVVVSVVGGVLSLA